MSLSTPFYELKVTKISASGETISSFRLICLLHHSSDLNVSSRRQTTTFPLSLARVLRNQVRTDISCALVVSIRENPGDQHGGKEKPSCRSRHQTYELRQLGRLTHYAFDAVLSKWHTMLRKNSLLINALVSAFLAGIKRSTGLTCVALLYLRNELIPSLSLPELHMGESLLKPSEKANSTPMWDP